MQALEKDGLDEVVKRAAAHGVAAGLHIAGGGDEDHRAFVAFQQRVIDELHAFTVREIVVQQDKPRLMLTNQAACLLNRRGDAHHAQMKILLDILAMQLCQVRLIFNDHNIKCSGHAFAHSE